MQSLSKNGVLGGFSMSIAIRMIYDDVNGRHKAVELYDGRETRVVPVNRLGKKHNRFSRRLPRLRLDTAQYSVETGYMLKAYIDNMISRFDKQRDIVTTIIQFLRSTETGRVMALSGLRGVGKTVAMLQAIREYADYDNVVLITLHKRGMTTTELNELVLKFSHKQAIFIDEVTFATDFVTDSALLADQLSNIKTKIILSGTDSLVLSLAQYEALYHRMHLHNLTYTGYIEANRVQYMDFDTYMRTGGMFKPDRFNNIVELSRYLDTAILNNITNTLARNRVKRYSNLQKLDEATLRTLLFRLMYVIICHSLGKLSYGNTNLAVYINQYSFKKSFEQLQNGVLATLGILSNITVSTEVVNELIDALMTIGVLIRVPNITNMTEVNYYFTNSAITVQLSNAIVKTIEFDEDVTRKDNYNIKFREGLIFESVVMCHFHRLAMQYGYNLYYYRDKRGIEVDVVLEKELTLDKQVYGLFEVKHTSGRDTAIVKTSGLNRTRLEAERKAVIYRGATGVFDTFTSNVYGTKQLTVEDISQLNKGTLCLNIIDCFRYPEKYTLI